MQAARLGQRRIREAMDFIHVDDPAIEACQNRTATFGSEIERQVRFPGHSDRMI